MIKLTIACEPNITEGFISEEAFEAIDSLREEHLFKEVALSSILKDILREEKISEKNRKRAEEALKR